MRARRTAAPQRAPDFVRVTRHYTERRDAQALGVFVFKPTRWLLASLLAASAVTACDAKEKAASKAGRQYGEPIGIRLDAHGAVPALAVAFAVTKGRDPSPIVGSLAGAVYAAAVACPAFVSAVTTGKTTRLELGAEKNVLEALGARADDVGGPCMTAALGGKPITMDRPDPMDVAIELRLAGDASARP
jgi:hypothetical protein